MNGNSSRLKEGLTLPFKDFDQEVIKRELRGTTLQVYLHLAKARDKDFGVREVQRALNLSSVSLAAYHLKKIEDLNLLTKNPQGKYQVSKLIPIGELEDFLVLKGRFLPKEIVYLSFTTSSLIFSIICFLLKLWGPMLALLFASALFGTIYSWIRFRSLWRRRDESE